MRDLITICETFDQTHAYHWVDKGWNRSLATFNTQDVEYRVVFAHKDFLDRDRDLYACEFYTVEQDGSKRIDITQGGDAFRVLSTVIAIIVDWVGELQPDVLGFSATGGSRIKLYKTMMKLASRSLPGYSVKETVGTLNANFFLTRDEETV
jgi:hypothetical protein